ncbi:MAG: DUF362 domain-containing protein [wastewater metagenome]|nr:DUF362 domain-containing protein [Candidatus Loosdrechtia aerotolerans]
MIIKNRYFYIVGMFIFLLLKLQWKYAFKIYSKPEAKKVQRKHIPNIYKEDDKTLVSVVHGGTIYSMLKEGIELLGGREKLDVQGKSVLIKPNIVNRYPYPANTNPLVIKHLIKLLQEWGASKIFVGDTSAIFDLPTKKNAIKSGIWEAIRDEDIEFIPLENHGWVEVDTDQGRFLKSIIVSELVYAVDKVINVPTVKTHSYAHYSMSLKNIVGIIHPRQRPYFIAPGYWDEVVAEFNMAYTPHLNILDATKIFTTKGPTEGNTKAPNILIITGDRIAGDVVGLSVIKTFGGLQRTDNSGVWEQRQIKRAIELQLGVTDPSEIKIVSKCIDTDESNFHELIQKIHHHVKRSS